MRISLKSQLILSFSIVIVIGFVLSGIVGIRLIGDTVIKNAQNKVRLDLNSAREVYREECDYIKNITRFTAIRFFMKDAILENDRERLKLELRKIREKESLDILTLTDENGVVLVRARNPEIFGDSLDEDIIDSVLSQKQVLVATEIVRRDNLAKEGKDLVEQARIEIIPTPKARDRAETVETSGMVIKAAAPVFDYDNNMIGVLIGGRLLNRDYEIVDKVKDIVYRGEEYKGKDIGTTTIFQDDLRISTNVRRTDGERAIGTRVSEEVYNRVVGEGIPWVGRAFVVNEWYRTAYEPIKNINGDIIGMLYVGMLEAPYIDMRNRVVFIFLGITLLNVILLSIIANIVANRITRPIKDLVTATDKVAAGDLSQRIHIESKNEIGQLADSFNQMTAELEKTTENYLELTRNLEEKVREQALELCAAQDQLIQSEKLSSLGKLAAGIAHEINNPLTSILINSHLISEKLQGDEKFRENLELIIDETSRCSKIVEGLLEFSRQTPPEKRLADINDIIEKTLLLFESQIIIHNVEVEKKLDARIPKIMVDIGKIEQVFTNIVLNALEAMPEKGRLTVESRISTDKKSVEIEISDTGCGIPKEALGKIFDPFFSTKGTKGTGLGLSISYGIVEQHGGTIEVKSEVGKGSTFIVLLPIE
ncbi:histidine kinase [bacterium]|nr:MAG: histidine kinase [bacterium]